MNTEQKKKCYDELHKRVMGLIEGESDWVSIMATVACELHATFDYFHWTGFYRVVSPGLLKIGPYQGGHGCLSIPFERGICGLAARTGQTQRVGDVRLHNEHIACSSSTLSEIVVPIRDSHKQVVSVLDVDSDFLQAFDAIDQSRLEDLCRDIYPG